MVLSVLVFIWDFNDFVFNNYVKLTGACPTYDGELVAIILAFRLAHELNLSPDIPVYIISYCQSAVKADLHENVETF